MTTKAGSIYRYDKTTNQRNILSGPYLHGSNNAIRLRGNRDQDFHKKINRLYKNNGGLFVRLDDPEGHNNYQTKFFKVNTTTGNIEAVVFRVAQ